MKLSQDVTKITIPGRKEAFRLYSQDGTVCADVRLQCICLCVRFSGELFSPPTQATCIFPEKVEFAPIRLHRTAPVRAYICVLLHPKRFLSSIDAPLCTSLAAHRS